ncbi:hypothetical protein C5E22_09155 [Pectobacterium parmentieri]|uniref:Uncharacterized protein n=1 Tax=Pectobacterium parmentieri TaxID=1905730 RepID=A0A8B3FAX3_PECPM|nr:hypothetical protein C5E26_13295 [Pectobacterium parmentieri]AYH06104.1 hypothetical protein C5E25_12470 [Pectobacterium parmentieri]AYH10651.1 hypothetical protein C5E24_13635 [Pectobacterium parmentieri]AYH14920.1 hypothetical protein C5E23_12420 [Pectobacterium parmentieri]AYH18638.1 hypothetical protein C5E22_09155 [Pectobacterium parmentieri]
MLYPSYFKLHVRRLRLVTRITYLCKLTGMPSLAAFLKLELFRAYSLFCIGRLMNNQPELAVLFKDNTNKK